MTQAQHASRYYAANPPQDPISPAVDFSDATSPTDTNPYYASQPTEAELDRSFSYRRGDDAHGLNQKSYAARAGAPPELALDTGPDVVGSMASSWSPQSAAVPSAAIPRSAVDHKSPLQKLELTLGDLTKEEKRIRAEEAEQRAVQRQATHARRRDPGPGSGQSREPPLVTSRPHDHLVYPTKQPTSRPVPDNGFARSNSKPRGSDYDTLGAWERRFGYDSILSGAAAAQALDAYQSAGQYYADPRGKDIKLARQEGSSTHARGPGSVQKANSAAPVAPDALTAHKLEGPSTDTPPQLAADQSARHNTDFGPPQSLNAGAPQTEAQGHRFSHLLHRDHLPSRRYQRSPTLEEWRSARTACLEAKDQDLEVDATPWWEKGDKDPNRRKSSQRKPSTSAPPSAYGFTHDGRMEKTSFRPPLSLKCGPLLRYTGISHDDTGRRFWRGSIMIVTDDENSSYSTIPSLKIFKQPMELANAPPPRHAEGDLNNLVHTPDHDPVAGLPKCSPTGETLYVKPADMIQSNVDLSRVKGNEGLFEATAVPVNENAVLSRLSTKDGEKLGKSEEVDAFRLHAERGFTFWRFNIEVELTVEQTRIAYRINHGPPIGFWVPAIDQSMNIMFHSCNGFSLSVNPDEFSGPDPMWRDVLNQHQYRPFHVMLGGGDQIYNDAVMRQTEHFQEWLAIKNPEHKHSAPFTTEMQEELENFYLERYAMWFSQGMFGLANSQIPMVNIWDDHDIIDGFGSYPDHFMSTPVFSGVGAVAFKYYMLFQHQSVPDEDEHAEPSWLLGAAPGPYIHEVSRSLFMSLGKDIAFLGLDCRTERMRDSIICDETYKMIFNRCDEEIEKGVTKHLLVLLGVPIAYPRLNFLENILTSRMMDPIKALGRTGILGNFTNRFDGGVEILDDLDDHWTAKHHKHERNWFINALQELAAEKSVRITILGGDVHLGAMGRFFSKSKLGIPKDRDHRYIPNVISSAIVNTPPPEVMADVLNRRNKIHHLDDDTDEDMVPIFTHDVTGKARNNQRLLPRRNWCSISEFVGIPQSIQAPEADPELERRPSLMRRFSLGGNRSTNSLGEKEESGASKLIRRLSRRDGPPSAYAASHRPPSQTQSTQSFDPEHGDKQTVQTLRSRSLADDGQSDSAPLRTNSFQRKPNHASNKAVQQDATGRQGHIDLEGGLNITLNCEVDQRDPSGLTTQYTLIVPALFYDGPADLNTASIRGGTHETFSSFGRKLTRKRALVRDSADKNQSAEETIQPADGHIGQSDGRGIVAATGLAGAGVLGVHEFANQQSGPSGNTTRGEKWNDEYERHMNGNELTPRRESFDNGGYVDPTNESRSPAAQVLESERNQVRDSDKAEAITMSRQGEREYSSPQSGRPDVSRRKSLKAGPPAPKNIDQLPASIRNRYSQFEEPRASPNSYEHFDTARNSPVSDMHEDFVGDDQDFHPEQDTRVEPRSTTASQSPSANRKLQKTRPATSDNQGRNQSLGRSQSLVQRVRNRFLPGQKHHEAVDVRFPTFDHQPQAKHTPWLHEAAQGSFGSVNATTPQTTRQTLNGPLTSHSTEQDAHYSSGIRGESRPRESGVSDDQWMGIDASPNISLESLEIPARRPKSSKFERLAGIDVLDQHDTMEQHGRRSGSDFVQDSSSRRNAHKVSANRQTSQHQRSQSLSTHQQHPRPYSGPGAHQGGGDIGLLPAPRPTGLGMSEKAARQLGYTDGVPNMEQEGSWLERAQAKAKSNVNRRSTDSATQAAKRSSWKRWI
ncbi:hypothetical protein FH972_026360 [Carpinus fangiana]|uniref:PhoD-like phosphatase domain-containing protein n=1 Tax=Carpinus fangiana TaxID=176857 RepID=A0A5N6L4Q9_9ROSI|nr:hypothetical protein FH972_026360 [Carpinus fangiana]